MVYLLLSLQRHYAQVALLRLSPISASYFSPPSRVFFLSFSRRATPVVLPHAAPLKNRAARSKITVLALIDTFRLAVKG